MSEAWQVEPREPGWLGRLIAPPSGGRPATLAFLLGVAGAAAFVGSLALDWQKVRLPTDESFQGAELHFASGIASIDTLSLVYTLCVVALLGIVGAVITRPELALRLRMAAAGVTVGVVGILAAVTVRLDGAIANLSMGFYGFTTEQAATMTFSYEPGIFCGYAAAVLPGMAIWVAGRTAVRGAAPARPEPAAPSVGGEPAVRHADLHPVRELSVSGSEPLDLTVAPGPARHGWPQR
jgi:hypothetical protein